jgi:hypothetical protein
MELEKIKQKESHEPRLSEEYVSFQYKQNIGL